VPAVTAFKPDEWPTVLVEMGKEAKLTTDQREDVLRYILTVLEPAPNLAGGMKAGSR
jgi:hypothetical protein